MVNRIMSTLVCATFPFFIKCSKWMPCSAHQVSAINSKCNTMAISACCPKICIVCRCQKTSKFWRTSHLLVYFILTRLVMKLLFSCGRRGNKIVSVCYTQRKSVELISTPFCTFRKSKFPASSKFDAAENFRSKV